MKEKGFTLVELLGVIIILSIIMLIAIPNVASMVERSKRDTYMADAKKLVSLTEYEIKKGNVSRPATGELVKVTLGDLSTTDVEKDSDGNAYDLNDSYVALVRKDGYVLYYVQLIARNSNGRISGISLTNSENLEADNRYDYYDNNWSSVPTTDSEIRIKIKAD